MSQSWSVAQSNLEQLGSFKRKKPKNKRNNTTLSKNRKQKFSKVQNFQTSFKDEQGPLFYANTHKKRRDFIVVIAFM